MTIQVIVIAIIKVNNSNIKIALLRMI